MIEVGTILVCSVDVDGCFTYGWNYEVIEVVNGRFKVLDDALVEHVVGRVFVASHFNVL